MKFPDWRHSTDCVQDKLWEDARKFHKAYHQEEDDQEQKLEAKREAKSSFGNEKIIIEKYLENARHVEVQIIGDMEGNFAVLGDRDCSIQRRHQKVIEEAPAPNINEKLRKEMASQAINVAKKVSYLGAGTIEFLVYRNNFYFIEMNTRLQVEHPVTELIFGVDLVEMQLRIANGEKIKINPLIKGHSIEARIYAENPELDLVEMIEVKEHPWYIGVQFHPELKSRIVKAHPLFRNFIAAAINQQEKEKMKSGNNYKSSVVHN